MSLAVDTTVADERWQGFDELEPRIAQVLARAAAVSGIALAAAAEVSVLLCDDATITTLNGTWRGKTKPTNVLSFPTPSPLPLSEKPLLGDIVVAFETTRREAEEEGKTLGDHLSHLLVHGFLHLTGHDHETAAEADTMEALETRILADLGVADPYAGAELLPAGAS